MDNKLSELSKPAWIVGEKEIADFMRGDEALLVRGHDPESTEPALRMYSQEYVSALRHESAVNWEAAASLNVENEELKRTLEAKDKRIAELEGDKRQLNEIINTEANRADAAEKQLVYSRDAIATWERKAISNFEECAKMSQCIEELEKRLATPVRLPQKNTGWDRDDGEDCWNNAIDACAKELRAAGFTVEGDEK